MADLTLKAAWDGTAVQRGIRSVQQSVGGLKSSIKSIGPTALTALGFGGALGAAVVLRGAIRGLIEDTTATEKLMQTIERRGVAMQVPFAEVEKTINRLRRTTAHGDTEITNALTHMVQQSGNLKGSLENLSLAVDLADTHNRSLADTSKIVARVMAGELEMAGDLSNGIKKLVRANSELIGTTKGTKRALEILRGESLGGSADYLKTTAGKLDDLRDSALEFRKELVRRGVILTRTGDDVDSYLTNFRIGLDALTEGLRSNTDAIQANRKAREDAARQARPTGDFGAFVNAQLEADYRAGRRLRPGSVPSAFDFMPSNQPEELPFPDLFAIRQSGRRQGAEGAQRTLDLWMESIFKRSGGIRQPKGRYGISGGGGDPLVLDPRSALLGGIRGGGEPLVLDLIGLGKNQLDETSDEIKERLREGLAKGLARDAQTRAQIAGTIEGGILAGARGGAEGLKQYIINALQELAAQKIAGAIAELIIPGGSFFSQLAPVAPPGQGLGNARAEGNQLAQYRRGMARG